MDKKNFVFQCVHCNKKYKSETCYNKHVNICRFLNNDSLNNDSEEREHIPNKSEMWQIILHQNNRLIKLEKELDKLKRYDYYQKKKISVIDYLNSKYKPNYSYEEWEKNITIGKDDLNYIFEHGSIKGTVLLLKNYSLKSLRLVGGGATADSEADLIFDSDSDSDSDCKIIPIVSTNQTLGKLYIYSNNCWSAMNQVQFKKMLQIVNKKVFAEFKTWCIETEKKMSKDKYSELYILNVEKLVSGKHTNQQIQTRIKTSMCNFLRIQLNNSNTYTTN